MGHSLSSATLGAVMFSISSAVTITNGKSFFTGNQAELGGGAYFGTNSSLNIKANAVLIFGSNSASNDGGAIHCQNGSLELIGESQFVNNSVDSNLGIGGAICALECNFTVSGRTSFSYNHASHGGAVAVVFSTAFIRGGSVDFVRNWASHEGGGLAIKNSTVTIENCFFEGNTGNISGGAISCQHGSLELAGESQFVNNSVDILGLGGAIGCSECNFTLSGRSSFSYNHAHQGGAVGVQFSTILFRGGPIGGIYCSESTYYFHSGNFTDNNAAHFGGAIVVLRCNAFHHNMNITENSGSALGTNKANVTFSGQTTFSRNSGSGGNEGSTGGG